MMEHLWRPRESDVNLSTNEHWIDYATADGASWEEEDLFRQVVGEKDKLN